MNADPEQNGQQASCVRCGRTMANDSPIDALAWAAELRAGRRVWLCPACAREYVRDIESKLPTDHWM